MDVVRVERKESVNGVVDFTAQPMLDSLADHGALLARYRLQVRVDVGKQVLAKCDVELLAWPGRAFDVAIPEFEVLHAERLCKLGGRLDERIFDIGTVCRGSPVRAKRQRNQGVSEQAALDFRERQYAYDLAAAFGNAVVRPMAKHILDDLAPADAMEETRVGASVDKCFPPLRVCRVECTHRDLVHRRVLSSGWLGCKLHQPPPRKSRSARSQRKSARSRRSRGSICLRLR